MSRGAMRAHAPEAPVRFADALRLRAFAVLFAAEVQSIAGDQLARVALSVLVFRETDSATATGLIFALTFLPAIAGGALLGSLGDRYRRRAVMITVDSIRAALFAVMAVPSLSTSLRVVLLVLAVFVGPLFTTAGISYLAAALSPETFRVATGLRMMTNQGAQVVGFAVGGALVAGLGPTTALLIDAGTFALSALLIGLAAPGVADVGGRQPESETGGSSRSAGEFLWQNRRLRALVGLSALAGFFIAPEGLAVPYAEQWSESTTRAGLLLGAIPLGSVVGVYVLVRRVPRSRRNAAAYLMAVLCGVPLAASALAGSFGLVFVCWFASGAFAAYQVEVLTQVVQGIPDVVRGRSLGLCNAVLLGAQGIGLAVFGGLGDALTPARSIVVAGTAGTALALILVLGPLRPHRQESVSTA